MLLWRQLIKLKQNKIVFDCWLCIWLNFVNKYPTFGFVKAWMKGKRKEEGGQTQDSAWLCMAMHLAAPNSWSRSLPLLCQTVSYKRNNFCDCDIDWVVNLLCMNILWRLMLVNVQVLEVQYSVVVIFTCFLLHSF